MSGRHVSREVPSPRQRAGELCARVVRASRGWCAVHDLGGNGRHRDDEYGAALARAAEAAILAFREQHEDGAR